MAGTKSVISVQSKRLAEDVNYVYDRQILFTNKIQFQRSRIEDLAFRIAKATKELVRIFFVQNIPPARTLPPTPAKRALPTSFRTAVEGKL